MIYTSLQVQRSIKIGGYLRAATARKRSISREREKKSPLFLTPTDRLQYEILGN